MSKPLTAYPEHRRVRAAHDRIKAATGGLGYWAAMDFIAWLDKQAAKRAAK